MNAEAVRLFKATSRVVHGGETEKQPTTALNKHSTCNLILVHTIRASISQSYMSCTLR